MKECFIFETMSRKYHDIKIELLFYCVSITNYTTIYNEPSFWTYYGVSTEC